MNWKPIDTAPKVEFASYLGFDAGYAEMGLTPEHALCVITWLDEDEDEDIPEGWQVQPLIEGLDVVFDDRTDITMWCELSELLPKSN